MDRYAGGLTGQGPPGGPVGAPHGSEPGRIYSIVIGSIAVCVAALSLGEWFRTAPTQVPCAGGGFNFSTLL